MTSWPSLAREAKFSPDLPHTVTLEHLRSTCFWKHAALRLLEFWPTVLLGERKESYEDHSSPACHQTSVPQAQLHVMFLRTPNRERTSRRSAESSCARSRSTMPSG